MGLDAYAARLVSTMTTGLLGSGSATRRVFVAITMSAATATSLSGCVFAYDAAKPEVQFVNDYPEPVVFIIEGSEPERVQRLRSGSGIGVTLNTCYGTGIRVESESGEALGRVDNQACPDWQLTINADGSLTYEDLTP